MTLLYEGFFISDLFITRFHCTGKEWEIFLEDSQFDFQLEVYLHYNVGRIHLSGTEWVCDLKLKCDKLPSLVSTAETATINT